MQDFDWDDIRYFLEVVNARSLTKTAEALGVNQSTVSRRISGLEKRLGASLFERSAGSGWILTTAGEEILQSAEHMHDNAQRISREVLKNSSELTGLIKVTTGDAGTQSMIIPTIAGFSRQYPQIELFINISNDTLDLAAREADVAIRVTDAPPPNVVGKRVGTLAMGIYGNEALAARVAGGDRSVPTIVWTGESIDKPDWLKECFPDSRITHRCNTIPVKIEAAAQGMGVTLLPTVLAERVPELKRIADGPKGGGPGLWILSHVDLRSTARVRVFRDYLVEKFSVQAHLIAGEAAT